MEFLARMQLLGGDFAEGFRNWEARWRTSSINRTVEFNSKNRPAGTKYSQKSAYLAELSLVTLQSCSVHGYKRFGFVVQIQQGIPEPALVILCITSAIVTRISIRVRVIMTHIE